MRLTAVTLAAVLAAPLAAYAQTEAVQQQPPTTAPATDTAPADVRLVSEQEFLATAARFNAMSTSLGQMAGLKAGVSPAVQAFGAKLLADHAEIAARLEPLLGDDLPEQAWEVKETYDALAALEGSAFEQAFLDAQAEAIGNAIRLFTGYSESGERTAAAAFAVRTLPTLLDHQTDIAELRS